MSGYLHQLVVVFGRATVFKAAKEVQAAVIDLVSQERVAVVGGVGAYLVLAAGLGKGQPQGDGVVLKEREEVRLGCFTSTMVYRKAQGCNSLAGDFESLQSCKGKGGVRVLFVGDKKIAFFDLFVLKGIGEGLAQGWRFRKKQDTRGLPIEPVDAVDGVMAFFLQLDGGAVKEVFTRGVGDHKGGFGDNQQVVVLVEVSDRGEGELFSLPVLVLHFIAVAIHLDTVAAFDPSGRAAAASPFGDQNLSFGDFLLDKLPGKTGEAQAQELVHSQP